MKKIKYSNRVTLRFKSSEKGQKNPKLTRRRWPQAQPRQQPILKKTLVFEKRSTSIVWNYFGFKKEDAA